MKLELFLHKIKLKIMLVVIYLLQVYSLMIYQNSNFSVIAILGKLLK